MSAEAEVESRTRSVTRVESEDVEELRCTGPCEDFYPEEELRGVLVGIEGEEVERPVCVYCSQSMWGIPVEEEAGVDVERLLRSGLEGTESLMKLVQKALLAIAPVGIAVWVAVMLMSFTLQFLNQVVEKSGNVVEPVEASATAQDVAVPMMDFFPVVIFILVFGVMVLSVVKNAPR